MKTIKLLCLLLLSTVTAFAQEYAIREVAIPGEANGIGTGSPIDVTKSYSECMVRYGTIISRLFENDVVTKVTFKGYNPGEEQTRHIKVWMTNDNQRNWTVVYDNDYTIPHGGSAEESIPLLELDFIKPFTIFDYTLDLIVECTGEAMEEPLYFDYYVWGEYEWDRRPAAIFSVMSGVKTLSGTITNEKGEPICGAHVLLSGYLDGATYEADADEQGHYAVKIAEVNQDYTGIVSAKGHTTYVTGRATRITLKDGSSLIRDFKLFSTVSYKKNQRATIILPVAPNPDWGRYYRPDRREGDRGVRVVFEREYTPQANIPYVIFPNMDFEINPGDYDTAKDPGNAIIAWPDNRTTPTRYLAMYGSYQNMEYSPLYGGEEICFLDSSSDCETTNGPLSPGRIGAFRACIVLATSWPDNPNFVFPGESSDIDLAYHPMIEDDKVWKAWGANSGNPAQIVYYYYFDGDTIIDGKTCKQMMCQRYVSPDYPYYDFYAQPNYLSKVGAWYEEDKQVYLYDTTNEQFKLMYDFSLADNGTFQMDGQTYVVGPKQTGGLEGFKGVYRDVMTDESLRCTTWLEGVGGFNGPFANAFDPTLTDLGQFLMSCTVGDEVIYLNDEYEDGATPEAAGARNRFDFTHTIKTKPKAPRRSEVERSVYGEYDKLQLGINLNLLADDYVVRITDDSGNVIYEKAVNASTIVGLNIDISGYAKGHYTVTVENSQESFTGEFDTLPTGIEETTKTSEVTSPHIYNLQGQRISTLQKGLNIVNGQKVYVK